MEASKWFDGIDGIVVLIRRDLLILDIIDIGSLYTSLLLTVCLLRPAISLLVQIEMPG